MTAFAKKTLFFVTLAAVVGYAGVQCGELYLRQKIEEKITASGMLKYRQMDISLLAGNLSFRDVAINVRWSEQAKSFAILAPKIRVTGIDWRRFYFDKTLEVTSLHLQSPDVTVHDSPADKLAQARELPADTTTFSANLTALTLHRVTFEGGCIAVFQGKKDQPDTPSAQANDINLELTGIALNLRGDLMGSLVFENADLSLRYLAVNNQRASHHFTLQQFHLNKADSTIELANLQLVPKERPSEFFNHQPYRKAWFGLNLPSARLRGWQFDRLLGGGTLVARVLELSGPDLKVRANQNLQPDPNGYRPMPQELLRSLPLAIAVDSVTVKNGKLFFENIGPGKTEVGVITFDPINALLTNLTNDSARIAEQKIMELRAVGYCQGKHPLHNHFWFDLASPAHAFSFKGSASDIPFPSLNSFIKPCTDVFFDNGTINSIRFEVNADGQTASGSLQMDYDGLDFSLLNKDRERRKILSKVVDFLFIKEANDNTDKDFQEGNIHARRDARLSFPNYWWSAIQSGIKTTLLDGMVLKKAEKRMGNGGRKG
jgi:hypothetical protein